MALAKMDAGDLDARRQGKAAYSGAFMAAAKALRNPSGSPLMARRSVRAGPLGRFAPRSHRCTVRTLTSYAAANTLRFSELLMGAIQRAAPRVILFS